MKCTKSKIEVDGYYCPEIKSRWISYGSYRLILWVWMLNEITMVFSPSEIPHNGFYAHAVLQAVALILIGLPLAYSEICLGQYTNCNIFTMWDFFPLFRNIGFASYYVTVIKAIYVLVLTSWYLIYTFYAAMDLPPWLNCNEFDDCKCMVKRVNVSIFQHCLEAQTLFKDDCGMKTASKCFFEREIGNNSTLNNVYCYQSWKTIIAVLIVCTAVFILSIKNEKIIQIIMKFFVIYICIVILLLFGRALSTNGTWYAKKISLNWSSYSYNNCFTTVLRGFLSAGTGVGVLLTLSHDVSFRSPATMTAISVSFFSFFVTFLFALIAFSGIKTMSYYHGEEDHIIEVGSSFFFLIFGSMSEIMTYFDPLPVWGFVWFSVGYITLFMNFWIHYLFLKESLFIMCSIARNYTKSASMILMTSIFILTLPMLCSDIAEILTDALEIMQIFNSFLLSFSLYWVYGIQKHNVDIIFMIGIKANYLLKLVWLLNPLMLLLFLYQLWSSVEAEGYHDSFYITELNVYTDILVLYVVLGVYIFIVITGILKQIIIYGLAGKWLQLISPLHNWGPKDSILLRSRNMFLPEIMTREFLYRQVRIRGYQKMQKCKKKPVTRQSSDSFVAESSWSALTSN